MGIDEQDQKLGLPVFRNGFTLHGSRVYPFFVKGIPDKNVRKYMFRPFRLRVSVVGCNLQ